MQSEGKKNWAALSHSLTEKPIDIGLQGVQDWTSRLLYRAEKLQDDANVETNTVVKETQTDMKQTTTVIQQTQTTVNATNISAQRVDKTTTEIDWKLSKMLTIAEQERQASAVCASKSMKGVVQDQLRSALCKSTIARVSCPNIQDKTRGLTKLRENQKAKAKEGGANV